jgi:hypothetical protein
MDAFLTCVGLQRDVDACDAKVLGTRFECV